MSSLSLAFNITAVDRNASRTLNNVGDAAERAGKKGSGFGRAMKSGMGLAVGAVAAAGLGRMFAGFIEGAAESAKIGRLTAAVVKSTGGAAKITAAQVNTLAGAISNKTAVDDEAIQSGANLLLTFTKVRNEVGAGNDIFNQATQAAVDMSVALGSDVSTASLQLGKALNDPIKGVTALSKAGVSFTQQQKDQIRAMVEAGDVLGAQKVILGEMAVQFGGAAAAAASPMERLKVVAGNLGESIGGLLLPYIEKFATWVADKAVPAIESFIQGFKDGEGPGGRFRDMLTEVKDAATTAFDYFKSDVQPRLETFAGFLKDNVQPALEALSGWIKDHKEELIALAAGVAAGAVAFGALAAAVAIYNGVLVIAAAAQIALNIAMSLNPIGIVIIAIVALVGAFVLAYQKSETFRKLVDLGFKIIATGAKWLWNNVLKPFFGWLMDTLKKGWETFQTFQNIIKAVWDRAKEIVRDGVRAVIDFVLNMADKILGALEKALGGFGPLKGKLADARKEFNKFRDGVNAALGGIKDKSVNVSGNAYFRNADPRGGALAVATGGAIHGPGSGTSDSIRALLSNGEHVWTAKEVSAAGGHHAVESMRAGVLKRAAGGPVEFNVRATTSTKAFAAAAKAFDRRFAQAVSEIAARIVSGGGAPVGGSGTKLVQFGRMLQGRGFRVAEHPSFGGVNAVHTQGSKHYSGRAIDVNWAAGTSAAEQRAIDAIVPLARAYGLRTIWRQAGHFNHAHFDYDRGGMLMPGQSGSNRGTSPERVLSGAQTAVYDRILAAVESGKGGRVELADATVDALAAAFVRGASAVADGTGRRADLLMRGG